MERITVKLYGRPYILIRFKAFPGTDKETEVTVAEHKLNALIEKRIKQERYHEVRKVDEMYGYYLPKEVDINDDREVRDSIESVMRVGEDIEPKRPYAKVSLALVSRIIEKIMDDDSFGTDADHRVKFSIAPYDISLNYFICKTSLAGEDYVVVFAPSVNAEAYLITEIAYGTDGLADDLRQFLGNVKYEEDRLALDEMVWMEASELWKVFRAWPDITVGDGDISYVTREQIDAEFRA